MERFVGELRILVLTMWVMEKPLMLNFKEFRIVREVLGSASLKPKAK